jgi:DNA-binding transcriptional ArsR family regulator
MSTPQPECVSPDRSPKELLVLRGRLVAEAQQLRVASEHYSLLAGETRLKILVLLDETGELCVCDLATILEMTPAAVSQHLSRLRSGRLVRSRRDGMTVYYQLADDAGLSSLVPGLERSRTARR